MSEFLKRGKTAAAREEIDRKVRETVEATLADIQARGGEAVRDLSRKFDNWDRADYRLTDQEIEECLSRLSNGRASCETEGATSTISASRRSRSARSNANA